MAESVYGLDDHGDGDGGNVDNDDDDDGDDDDQAQSGLKYWNVSAWEPLKESIVSRHRAYCYFTHLASSSSLSSPSSFVETKQSSKSKPDIKL